MREKKMEKEEKNLKGKSFFTNTDRTDGTDI